MGFTTKDFAFKFLKWGKPVSRVLKDTDIVCQVGVWRSVGCVCNCESCFPQTQTSYKNYKDFVKSL